MQAYLGVLFLVGFARVSRRGQRAHSFVGERMHYTLGPHAEIRLDSLGHVLALTGLPADVEELLVLAVAEFGTVTIPRELVPRVLLEHSTASLWTIVSSEGALKVLHDGV